MTDNSKAMLDKMNFLHAVSQTLSEQKPLPRLLHEIIESSKKVMNAEACSLLIHDARENKLRFVVVAGDQADYLKGGTVEFGVGIAGWVAAHRQPLLISNCYDDPRFNPEYDRKSEFESRTMMCVPLVRKDQLLGVIQVINKIGGDHFDRQDLTIFETLAGQCAIAIENSRLLEQQIESKALERELETAREIQLSLLPTTLPDYSDLDIATQLISAKQVGGDYYNIISVSDTHSLFFITDVTGKSISAALIVSTIHACLQTFLTLDRNRFDLARLVSSMNEVLLHSTTGGKFASAWFGLYDHNRKMLIYINAGHNPPFLFRENQPGPLELMTGGLPLGCFSEPYQQQELQMQVSDILVMYTDGVVEAWDENRNMFGEERLIKSVVEYRTGTAHDILSGIELEVRRHVGQATQNDDFTCVILRFV
ncbi:SpoIIE family protein phosphatase [bacterium]|nr:SpoIIE family protein phosphatase [bacterium]